MFVEGPDAAKLFEQVGLDEREQIRLGLRGYVILLLSLLKMIIISFFRPCYCILRF
jgi:hypothetical protein